MTLYQAKENSSHDVRGQAPDRSTGEWWRAKLRHRGTSKTPKLPSSKRNTKGAFGGKIKSKK